MKLKYILIVLILLLSIANVDAVVYRDIGHGETDSFSSSSAGASIRYTYTGGGTVDVYAVSQQKWTYSGGGQHAMAYNKIWSSTDGTSTTSLGFSGMPNGIYDLNQKRWCQTNDRLDLYYGKASSGSQYIYQSYIKTFVWVGIDDYSISGSTDCLDSVSLYLYNGAEYEYLEIDDLSDNTYSFKVFAESQYKLKFNNGHEYEFTCISNEVYNYNACRYITLNFRDNCNNLIPNTEFQYCNHGTTIVCYLVNTPSGSYDILFEDQDFLEIWTYKHDGILYYNIENPEDISYSINDPHISWNNNIFVKDYNNSLIIEDALVSFSQSCIIDTSLNPVRNKYTNIDGYAIFDQCELDTAHITVTKDGYKTFSDSISPIHLNAQKSGQTTIVNLVPNDDVLNESGYTLTNYDTYIYFKNVDGNITNSILDTDSYVDLYYYNNNSEEAFMVLQFYKTNIYTGKTILLNWNIPHGESGYKRILNTNYTQTNYGYYGYLYSDSISGWNTKKRLTVSNNTIEVVNHYQNLTKGLWFVNKNGNHSIDYRNEIKIIAYAKSNYSFLHDITLKLYDNNVLIESITLDVFDFIASDIENYYEWNLGYNYTKDHNYTVEMYGYDDTFLKLDYINAIDLRKNKLTIIVKDRAGSTLTNSYIFLEGYPSLSTSNTYFNSYENLDNGIYKYKASKSGYSGAGWDNINLTDGDKIVSYVLSYDAGNTTYLPEKMSDNTISALFFPFIFFLLIAILLGGLMHVVE